MEGWNVTVVASAFTYSGDNGGLSVVASNLSITSIPNPSMVSGQAIDPKGGPMASGGTGTLDVPRKVVQAKPGFGQGVYRQVLTIRLTVPGGTRAGTYTTILTATIAAGP